MSKKKRKKTSKTAWGCLTLIIIVIISSIIFVPIMKENYDRLEKEANKETFDKILVVLNESNEHKDLSNTQKKTTAVKLFLLNRCSGGDETLKELIAYEQNILYDACIIVQNNNIIDNFSENNDDLKKIHIKVLNADFKGAVKLYDWYISE